MPRTDCPKKLFVQKRIIPKALSCMTNCPKLRLVHGFLSNIEAIKKTGNRLTCGNKKARLPLLLYI
jgi:hypothetical protein